jgi:cystathionine beta-lyase family protein involved in aluminum resistance
MMEKLGFEVNPASNGKRADIIQSVKFNDPDKLIKFCKAIQSASPVDSFVTPEPWDMPGYQHQVIMAAGTFVSGASIEISADAPIKPPYVGYLQGGLTYESGKLAVMAAASALI